MNLKGVAGRDIDEMSQTLLRGVRKTEPFRGTLKEMRGENHTAIHPTLDRIGIKDRGEDAHRTNRLIEAECLWHDKATMGFRIVASM